MWLIICDLQDDSALSLVTLLESHDEELTVLLPDHLVKAKHVHQLGAEGPYARTELRNGVELDLADVSLLVNRLYATPQITLERCELDEQGYVQSEWTAFFTSFLNCCGGPVLNPPAGDNIGGHPLNELECLHYAAICGLPITPLILTDHDNASIEMEELAITSHLVVGECVLPKLPHSLSQGARRLATVLGLSLLQIDFALHPNGHYVFHRCTAHVEFRHAPGPELVAALRKMAASQVHT